MSDVELLGTYTRNSAQTAELFRGDDIEGVVHVFATTTARDLIPGATFRTGELCVITADDSKWKWNGSAWVTYAGFGSAGAGGGDGFAFTFDTATTDADHGNGKIAFDSAIFASITKIYIDNQDASGNNVAGWVSRLDDSIGSVKGYIRLGSRSDPTKWMLFRLLSLTNGAGYDKLTVDPVTGTSLITMVGDTVLSFDSLGVLSDLNNQALTKAKSITYNGEVDNGNSGTADTIDWTTGDFQKSTLTGNVTYTFTAPLGVCMVQLRVTQDVTGGRTITFPGSVTGSPPQPATAAGAVTFYNFFYDGTNYIFASISHTSLSDLTTGDPHTQYSLVDGTRAFTGAVTITQVAKTAGSPYAFKVTGGAHTTLTAGGEAIDVDLALNRTVQFGTGGITTQRAVLLRAPTYGFVGASTITNAATLAVTGAPVAGTNATLTNRWALWIQADNIRADGSIELGGGTVSTDTVALVRVAHNKTIISGRNSAGSADASLVRWGSTANLLEVGDSTNTDVLYLQLKTAGAFNLRFGTVPYVSVSTSAMVFGGSSAFGLSFSDTALVPTINQQTKTSGTGAKFTITAQPTGSGTGGALDIGPGGGTTAGGLGRLISGGTGAVAQRIAWNDTGVGLYTATPVAQAARVGQLTDSSGGSATSTLGAISATYVQAEVRDSIASLAAKINGIETAIHNIGLTA